MKTGDDTIWTVPLAILAAMALLILTGLAVRGLFVLYARQKLAAAFRGRLSPRAISTLNREPATPNRKGETRTVTALSCAIRGHAGLCARFADDPAGLAAIIRTAMSPLTELARKGGGLVSQFDGESFGAIWNAPLDDGEHTMHSCETADRMIAALAAANARQHVMPFRDEAPPEAIEIEIGIATGQAVAGAFDEAPYAYGVAGKPVLYARHIRALSVQYGFAIVASEETKKAAEQSFAFLEIDCIAGPRGNPMLLYAMYGNRMMRASPKFRALSTFHEHIFQSLRTQQWKRTRLLIDQCRKLSGASQKLYDLHEARIAWYEKNPPSADWDGAFRPVLK